MSIDTYINPGRFSHLLKNEVLTNYKTILIAIGAIFGLLLVVNVSSVASSNSWLMHTIFYPLTLFIGGFFITGISFNDLHNKEKGYSYLTLPASIEEKFLSRLLLTTVGYIIVSLVFYWLFSVIAAGLTELFFNRSHQIFNPFTPFIWKMIRLYLITQSVIFFGALFFRKNTLLKTISSLTGLGIALSIIVYILVKLIFWKYFDGWSLDMSATLEYGLFSSNIFNETFRSFFIGLGNVVEFSFLWIMAPFFWVISYLRLRETEV